LAVSALVLGILGTLCSLTGILFWIGIPLGLIGMILGIVARKNAVANQQPTGMPTAGMVLGIIGLVLGVFMYVLCAAAMSKARQIATDPKMQEQNKEFNEAFKKAIEESQKQQQPAQPAQPAAPSLPAAPAAPAKELQPSK